jgi:gas vesicle protein GvpA/GvpJ/GvpM family
MALDPSGGRLPQTYGRSDLRPQTPGPSNLADILERVLDKGIVIAGDIQLNLLDIELITIKIRLLVASVDRAREMGINWWESDPTLTVNADDDGDDEKRSLRERVDRLERMLGNGETHTQTDTETKTESQTERKSRGGSAKRR